MRNVIFSLVAASCLDASMVNASELNTTVDESTTKDGVTSVRSTDTTIEREDAAEDHQTKMKECMAYSRTVEKRERKQAYQDCMQEQKELE